MIKDENNCVDLGGEFCPCQLAEEKQCLSCAKVDGGSCEDCNWDGVCIFSQFKADGSKVLSRRFEQNVEIVSKEFYSEDLVVLGLKVDRSLALNCSKPGTFLFIRNPDYETAFQVPISVLTTRPAERVLYIGVQKNGVKTSTVYKADKSLIIRGPYRSGLIGRQTLYKAPTKTILIAKGIAIAPFANVLEAMTLEESRNVYSFIDLNKITLNFLKKYFGRLPVKKLKVVDFNRDLDEINRIVAGERDNITNVYALASPYFTERIGREVPRGLVYPNHANMCCGEGICGACTCVDDKGELVKRCKKP